MFKTKFLAFWKKTVGKVVIIGGFLGGLATFLGSLSSIRDFFRNFNDDKGVQIVDLSIGTNDTIDIKLRNNGKEVAYLKKIQIDFKKSWVLIPDSGTHLLNIPPSEIYNIEIDSKKATPYTIESAASQGIKANEVDRFLISLHNDMANNYTYVYLVDIKLVMNEDNEVITKSNVMFSFEMPLQHYMQHKEEVQKAIAEINAVNGYKSQPLTQLINKLNSP